jgi:hypothetical protein
MEGKEKGKGEDEDLQGEVLSLKENDEIRKRKRTEKRRGKETIRSGEGVQLSLYL